MPVGAHNLWEPTLYLLTESFFTLKQELRQVECKKLDSTDEAGRIQPKIENFTYTYYIEFKAEILYRTCGYMDACLPKPLQCLYGIA